MPRKRNTAAVPSVLLALFAILWAIYRACHQSITLDEADTFLARVAPRQPNYWTPHSNNHLLNSLLMRLSTTLFGLSTLTVRLPALLGGSAYIGCCYILSGYLTRKPVLRAILLACLVCNPFLSDYYVAARGYGLAIGLSTAALTLIASLRFQHQPPENSRILSAWSAASALLALAFTANFSFAFFIATLWVALLVWTIRFGPTHQHVEAKSLAAAAILPALAVLLLLPAWTLLHWPKGELWDGTTSVVETVRTVTAASVHQPSPAIQNPSLHTLLNALAPFLFPATTLLAVAYAALLAMGSGTRGQDGRTKATLALSLVAASVLSATLGLHWLAFHMYGLL